MGSHGLHLPYRKTGVIFQPTVALGGGRGIFKDRLGISHFMGDVLVGNIFTGAHEETTRCNWTEVC